MDTEWCTFPLTRRFMGGACAHLAGGVVAYKVNLLPTVALSSTEAEFMEATQAGKLLLFCRSVLWDLSIPQTAATIAYEDNDACTSMANAQKPTSRTRHIDIKYHVLCQWVEQDLILLERIATSLNTADIFTKILGPLLFRRHCDYLMGRVPPQYSACYKQFQQAYNSWNQDRRDPVVVAALSANPFDPRTASAARFVTAWYYATEFSSRLSLP